MGVNQVVELDSSWSWAVRYRGEILLILKRFQEALGDFNKSIELKSESDWAFYYRALAYQALNQPEQAKMDFDRAIQLAQKTYDEKPTDHQNTFNLALYHLAAGSIQQAWQFYREGLKHGAGENHIREAIRDLEDFLRVFPGHGWATKAKAELEKRL